MPSHLEAGRASEARVPIRGNMHVDTRVIVVADFKYEVRNALRDYQHCLTLVYWAIALLLFTICN